MGGSSAPDPRIGSEIAGYRVERVLGRGGMGVVYLAEDLTLARRVALKVLSPELSEDAEFRERFRAEWRLAASIDHPNVIPIYEAGDYDGTLFIAMRYVEGTDLKQLIDETGALAPARAVGLVSHVAAGLDAAHRRGLVHRDVKPSNVLIAMEEGEEFVYLADFGLTKPASDEEGARESIELSGSYDYVSPEQITGRAAKPASDIYALGAVLYEALTASVPFPMGGGKLQTLFAHVNNQPPVPTGLDPHLPPALDAVVARAMAKESQERYETGTELAQAAEAALPRPGGPLRRRVIAVGVALVLVIVAAVVAAVLLTRGGGDDGVGPIVANTIARIDPETNEVVAVVPVGQSPIQVAANERAVLVGSREDGTVSVVNPDTGEIVRAVSVEGTPLALAVDEGFGWVTSTSLGQGVLAEIDLDSGRILRSVDLDVSDPSGVAVGEGAIWIAGQDISGNAILRLDPATLAIVATVPTELTRPLSILAANGAIWYGLTRQLDPPTDVSRIDPATDAIAAAIQFPFVESVGTLVLAAGAESLWVGLTNSNEIWRVDTATNEITETVTLGETDAIDCLVFAHGSLWATVVDGEEIAQPAADGEYALADSARMLRVDPQTGDVISQFQAADDSFFMGLAAGPGAVWLATSPVEAVGGACGALFAPSVFAIG